MPKRVAITSKPGARAAAEPTADDWVNNRATGEKMKRLIFDIPESLHRRIKIACAQKGVMMADDLRELLERATAISRKRRSEVMMADDLRELLEQHYHE